MELFFARILSALGWNIAEKKIPFSVNVNGHPLPLPPSWRGNIEDYLNSVVFPRRTHEVYVTIPGGIRTIKTPEDLRTFLQQDHHAISINLVGL